MHPTLRTYKCSFFEHCWKDLPAITVFNISNIRKKKADEMIAKWIIEPGQIESDTKLTEEQWSEIEAAKNVAIVAKNVTFSNLK